jgi:hypothetical protein
VHNLFHKDELCTLLIYKKNIEDKLKKENEKKEEQASGRAQAEQRSIDFASKHAFSFSSHKFSFLKNRNLYTQL